MLDFAAPIFLLLNPFLSIDEEAHYMVYEPIL